MVRLQSTLLALVAGSAFADDPGTPIVEMGSRTFLVGQIPWDYEADQNFSPIDGIDWIKDIMDADPVTRPRHAVFYLEVERLSLSDHDKTNRASDRFGNRDLVPDAFRIDELVVQLRPDAPRPFAECLYLVGIDDPAWSSSCGFPRPHDQTDYDFQCCLMSAFYQYDLSLPVDIRIYGPPPSQRSARPAQPLPRA